jgi:hypothetical protein
MDLIESAQTLVKFGAILGMVLGLLSMLFWLFTILLRFCLPFFLVNVFDSVLFMMSIFAILISYYILTRFSPRLEEDPSHNALILVGLGILVAIGSWGIAGLLIIIGAVLVLIEETG